MSEATLIFFPCGVLDFHSWILDIFFNVSYFPIVCLSIGQSLLIFSINFLNKIHILYSLLFQIYNSVLFSIFLEGCTTITTKSRTYLSHQKNPYVINPINSHFSAPPTSPHSATISLLAVSMDLPFQYISYK